MPGDGTRAAQCGLVLLFWLLVPTVDQVTAIIMLMMIMIMIMINDDNDSDDQVTDLSLIIRLLKGPDPDTNVTNICN